jgi:hypothetical protein
MRYVLALLLFVLVWIVSTILVWLASGLFRPIRYDEGITIGWCDDWRNRIGNIVGVVLAVSLVVVYLRKTKKRL